MTIKTPKQIAAGLGTLQKKDLARAERGDSVTAITLDHTPKLVRITGNFTSELTELGVKVLAAVRGAA